MQLKNKNQEPTNPVSLVDIMTSNTGTIFGENHDELELFDKYEQIMKAASLAGVKHLCLEKDKKFQKDYDDERAHVRGELNKLSSEQDKLIYLQNIKQACINDYQNSEGNSRFGYIVALAEYYNIKTHCVDVGSSPECNLAIDVYREAKKQIGSTFSEQFDNYLKTLDKQAYENITKNYGMKVDQNFLKSLYKKYKMENEQEFLSIIDEERIGKGDLKMAKEILNVTNREKFIAINGLLHITSRSWLSSNGERNDLEDYLEIALGPFKVASVSLRNSDCSNIQQGLSEKAEYAVTCSDFSIANVGQLDVPIPEELRNKKLKQFGLQK